MTSVLLEDSTFDGDYDFDGKNIMFIRRQFRDTAWKLDTIEQHSANGETKIIIRNPTSTRFLVNIRIQGNTFNQTNIRSYVDDIKSLETLCNHHGGEQIPIALELNEVSQDTRMVLEFKLQSPNRAGVLNNGSITGYIVPLYH